MSSLLQQLRVKFSSLGEDEPTPRRKAVSFKEGRKEAKNWFQRQLSGQMNQADRFSDGEFAAAVAAAAYAVNSLEKEDLMKQKRPVESEGFESSLSKARSRREESTRKPSDSSKILRWFSGQETKEERRSTGDSSFSKSSTLDKKMSQETMSDSKPPQKAMATTPSIKKTPTFSDKYLNDTGSKRYGGEQEMKARPTASTSLKPSASSTGKEKQGIKSMGSGGIGETKADAWENEEMNKIKKRYEKTNSTILEWEDEKKTKAKHRQHRKQKELDTRRGRTSREYREDIARIDKIAGGARALADERKRNDEAKVLEKAKVIRATGKLPRKCLCF